MSVPSLAAVLLFPALLIVENTVTFTLMSQFTAATVQKPSFIRRVFEHTSRKPTSKNAEPPRVQRTSEKEKLHRKSSLSTPRFLLLRTTTRHLPLLLLQRQSEFAKCLPCFLLRSQCKCGTRQWDTLNTSLPSTVQLIIPEITFSLISTLLIFTLLNLLFHLCTSQTTSK